MADVSVFHKIDVDSNFTQSVILQEYSNRLVEEKQVPNLAEDNMEDLNKLP